MTANSKSPAAGDLLILSDQQPGGGYTLAVAPDGPSQLRYASYDEALEVAIRWASTSGVSIWRADDDTRFDRVEFHTSVDVRTLSFDQLVSRVRGEYIEMPGLWLTSDQGARLWSLERAQCEQLLVALVNEGFLTAREDGKYGRVTSDSAGGRAQTNRAMIGEPASGTQKIPSR
jgi:hypothetical protein